MLFCADNRACADAPDRAICADAIGRNETVRDGAGVGSHLGLWIEVLVGVVDTTVRLLIT
jgi:hypothetical protein